MKLNAGALSAGGKRSQRWSLCQDSSPLRPHSFRRSSLARRASVSVRESLLRAHFGACFILGRKVSSPFVITRISDSLECAE